MGEINKHVSDGVNKLPVENKCDLKPKTVKTKEAKEFSKSEAERVDVMDTLQRAISSIEKEMAKNPTFLQKAIDTRNTNSVIVALSHHDEDFIVNSLQLMMRRTTEQITDERQVLLIQNSPRTVDVPLLQYIDTTVDVQVAKALQKTTRGLHNEVQRNQDGQEAAFCPAHDREQEPGCFRQ